MLSTVCVSAVVIYYFLTLTANLSYLVQTLRSGECLLLVTLYFSKEFQPFLVILWLAEAVLFVILACIICLESTGPEQQKRNMRQERKGRKKEEWET